MARGKWRNTTRLAGEQMNDVSDSLFSDSKVGRLRKIVYDLWRKHKEEENLPTNGRFLYYELVTDGVISKTTTARPDSKKGRRSDQNLIDALTDLRKAKLIPWEDIKDETRELTTWRVYPTIAEGMKSAFLSAKLDLWESDTAPMILCESRSLAGVLERLAWEFHCPIASTNGQCVGFLHTTVGPALSPGQTVLYLGDADFAGNHIEDNTRKVLQEIVGGPLDWRRVAITDDQVKKFNLPVIQKYDKRTKSRHPAVETEALGQSRIVALLRTRLEKLMPAKRRKAVLEREERERIKVGQKLGYIQKDRPCRDGGEARTG